MPKISISCRQIIRNVARFVESERQWRLCFKSIKWNVKQCKWMRSMNVCTSKKITSHRLFYDLNRCLLTIIEARKKETETERVCANVIHFIWQSKCLRNGGTRRVRHHHLSIYVNIWNWKKIVKTEFKWFNVKMIILKQQKIVLLTLTKIFHFLRIFKK